MRKILTTAGTVLLFLTTIAESDESQITFPKHYASTFTNYLSLDRTQDADQIIRLFANDIAMQGPGKDGKLPYGSVLAAEV